MSGKFPQEAKKIMNERFGHDTLLSLATTDQNIPYVRTVNAYYEDGCFYIITYAASNKMKQIGNNPIVEKQKICKQIRDLSERFTFSDAMKSNKGLKLILCKLGIIDKVVKIIEENRR